MCSRAYSKSVSQALRPVLVIDDSDDDLFFARRSLIFSKIRNPVVTINGGEQAISYFSQVPPPAPCIAFVDLKMPMVSGFDLLAWINRNGRHAHLKIVILSGSDQPQDRERALALGADGYLVKHPDPLDLLHAVEAAESLEVA